MFFNKINKDLIFYLFTWFCVIFFLYSKNSFFSHWSLILDQDVTIIYNSLLLGSNIDQEYLDHPAFTTVFLLNIFYKIAYFFQLLDVKNIEGLINSVDKNYALQTLHNFSQILHIFYATIFIFLIYKCLNHFLNDKICAFLIGSIILVSPSFIFLFDLIRSEILSLVFLLLYYIFLNKYCNENLLNPFFAGIFITFSLLAKVQIVILIIPLITIIFLNNFDNKIEKKNFKINKYINFFVNILIISLLIYYIDNFFYKRIDKVFFLILIFFHIIFFSYYDKKKLKSSNYNFSLFIFMLGCISAIFFLKILKILGLTSFHISIVDIISSPITQMSNITTGYSVSSLDNMKFLLKIKDVFIEAATSEIWGPNENNKFKFYLLFNKFSIFTYLISLPLIIFLVYKKRFKKIILIIILNLIISFVNLIFNFRPYGFYLIYSLPFNLILCAILIDTLPYKRFASACIFIIFFSLNFGDIKFYTYQTRSSEKPVNNMNIMCAEENISSKGSYMRYWHQRYDEKFMNKLCFDYFNK